MARHDTIEYNADGWTELTANDVTSITIQAQCVFPTFICVTETGVVPDDNTPSFRIGSYETGHMLNVTLADLAPGLTAPARVFARTTAGKGKAQVSHA